MILHINLKSRHVASVTCIFSYIIVTSFLSTNGAYLNRNGGYDVIIAVEKNTPPPTNAVIYMNKIQMIMHTMSAGTFFNTNQRFHINSVQLLVPREWNLLSTAATTQSFETADIRISNKFKYLRADNPNECGMLGQYVETPLDFFEHNEWDSPYGTPWKALATQWARYRWGIWEEHGYPGDDRFPYFYQKAGRRGWQVTGCSDVELEGQYLTTDNKSCDASGDEYPGDNCRLHPDMYTSPATSSLMNFHWIENVEHYCNESTHIRDAPNRQNRNCGHRSSWEVIRETEDYLHVSLPPPTEIPDVHVFIYTDPLIPDIVLLQDIRDSTVSEDLRTLTVTKLSELFKRGSLYPETVAKIISFPKGKADTSNAVVNTNVEWNAVKNEGFFLLNLHLKKFNGTRDADINIGVLDAIEECIVKENPAGCVIIVLKAGVEVKLHSQVIFEQDVLAALRGHPRVRLFAVEVINEGQPESLQRLSDVSRGKQISIVRPEDIEIKLSPLVKEISKLCMSVTVQEPIDESFHQVYRGHLKANELNKVQVLEKGLNDLEFHITTAAKIRPDQLYIHSSRSGRVVAQVSPISAAKEWGGNHGSPSRYTYSWAVSNASEDKAWMIYYDCNSNDRNCEALLHVFGSKSNQEGLVEKDENDDIDIRLTTSEELVDMTKDRLSNSPLNIFASAHKLGQPVVDLEIVATIQKANRTWSIQLRDNGIGNPDLYPNDGVYSASFIPPEDGYYRINAFIRNRECSDHTSESSPNGIKLLLPDQTNIGCFPNNVKQDAANAACVGAKVIGDFGRVVTMRGAVRVVNSGGFVPGKPYRILDLKGVLDRFSGMITFTFTAPGLVGLEAEGATYVVYQDADSANLVGNVNKSHRLDLSYPARKTGSLELIRIRPEVSGVRYYAIETVYNGLKSGPSNIVSLESALVPVSTEHDTETSTGQVIETSSKLSDSTSGPANPSTTGTTTSSATTSTEALEEDFRAGSSKSKLETYLIGIIAGGVVGGIILITAVLYIAVRIVKSKQRKQSLESSNSSRTLSLHAPEV